MKRLAIIGLGAAARTIHLPAITSLGTDVELCGACDPQEEARATFARLAPGVPLYENAATLLAEQKPQWVVVATPPAHHRESCLLALEAGAHVFCEKPMGETLDDADAILAAASGHGRQIAVNFEFPSMPIFAAALAQAGSPGFGRPLIIQAWQTVDEWPGSVEGWRAQGQTLREFGCHVIDLIMRFFDDRPQRIYARMPRPAEGLRGDPVNMIILDFPGDRSATIVLQRLCRGPHQYLEMRIDGEQASLRTSIGGQARFTLGLNPRTRLPLGRLDVAAGGQAWLETGDRRQILARNELKAFALATARHLGEVMAAVERREKPPGDGIHARRVLAVVEAAYTSAASGIPVSLS